METPPGRSDLSAQVAGRVLIKGMTMINVIPSNERHFADHGWLKTHWHFSFGDYHDPKNLHWSALRVFNDDIVAAQTGFDTHPHRDMEIVTYVIDGTLTHSDSLGHTQELRTGEVQVMSAGKGILHSERNADPAKSVHLIQLWIFPRTKGSTPRWEQRGFSIVPGLQQWMPVVSSGDVPGTLAIDQDASIRIAKLAAGQALDYQPAGTHAYLFVIEGSIKLNGNALGSGDQARIADEANLRVVADSEAHLMLLDLP